MPAKTPHHSEIRWNYSLAELWADGVVHVIGVSLAVIGSVVFLIHSIGKVGAGQLTAIIIYLVTLLFSIIASAAYNIWPVGSAKWALRRVDHSAIYLLIAGTYTPFMAISEMWWMLAGVWITAFTGVALKLVALGRYDRLSILLYLALGWSGVVAYDTLMTRLPNIVFILILAGGIVYSLGTIFHLAERMRFQNAIWHGFVVIAACIHFVAVWHSTSLATSLG